MTQLNIGYLIGSLSKNSINRQLAKALVKLAPENLAFTEIAIRDLPLYNYDLDNDPPQSAKDFKQALAAVDGLLFVTPEYNRSIPGGLKNALDWGTRPYGQNSFSKKPSGIIGASPGAIGTAVAQQHLRAFLAYCDSPQLFAPEAYIQFKPGLIGPDDEITNAGTKEFLTKYMQAFADHISCVVNAKRGAKS